MSANLLEDDLVDTPPDFYEEQLLSHFDDWIQTPPDVYCMPCNDGSVDGQHDHSSEEEQEEQEDLLTCENCQRKQIPHLEGLERDLYWLQFHSHVRKKLIARKSYRIIPVSKRGEGAEDEVVLCHQCTAFLTDSPTWKDFSNVWPSFIWKFLTNRDVNKVWPGYAWRFIPNEWRKWWTASMHWHNEEESFFVDLSLNQLQMKSVIDSGMLPKIRDTTNKLLIPTILCPWGGSEYIHECGTIPMDIIIQRYE